MSGDGALGAARLSLFEERRVQKGRRGTQPQTHHPSRAIAGPRGAQLIAKQITHVTAEPTAERAGKQDEEPREGPVRP